MSKKLILFTRRFPFHTTEAFIESEIAFLAAKFDKIIIFPTETASYKRTVPANVEVSTAFAEKYKNKRGRLLRALFSGKFFESLAKHKKYAFSKKGLKILVKYMATYLAYYDFFLDNKDVHDADILYCYWLNEAPLAIANVKQKKGLKARVLARAHRYDIYEGLDSTPLFWPYRAETVKSVDEIFVISNNGKEYLDNKYSSGSSNIRVSKLGVTDRHIVSTSSADQSYNIVSVSRVHRVKRVDLILASVASFAEQVKPVRVTWTHFGDGNELANIKEKAQTKPGNLEIDFKGNVQNAKIYEHYAEEPVDVFVNLSSSEGIPVSIMEAISFGIPAIATNVGGSGEIVVPETGVLLDENPTVAQVAKALTTILVDKSVVKQDIKAYYRANYDAEKNYAAFSEDVINLLS